MSSSSEYSPLEERVYCYKEPFKNFYCPLCGTKRSIVNNYRLTGKNFIQILLITVMINLLIFPFTGFKGGFFIFLVWGGFEFIKRSLFKKEIPCPHCGFDASWYKRDIKVARRLVQEYWDRKSEKGEGSPVSSLKEGAEVNPDGA